MFYTTSRFFLWGAFGPPDPPLISASGDPASDPFHCTFGDTDSYETDGSDAISIKAEKGGSDAVSLKAERNRSDSVPPKAEKNEREKGGEATPRKENMHVVLSS